MVCSNKEHPSFSANEEPVAHLPQWVSFLFSRTHTETESGSAVWSLLPEVVKGGDVLKRGQVTESHSSPQYVTAISVYLSQHLTNNRNYVPR